MRLLLLALLLVRPESTGLIPVADETTAITNVRIITVTKGEIERGTILIKGEKIAELGKDVKVPPGAKVIDGKGLTAFPGIVHAMSRMGALPPSGGGGGATLNNLAADEINPALDVFSQIVRTGVTTYAIHPAGGILSGQGAILKPFGWNKESMLLEKAAFLRISFQASTSAKDALRQALEGARKAIEAEKKPPAKPAEPSKEPKPASPEGKPEDKTPVMVRFLKGELPAIVEIAGPGDLLHFWQVMEPYAEFKTRLAYALPSDAYKTAEELGRRKARVILRPGLTFAPFTRDRINPPAELAKAGAVVALAPWGDGVQVLEGYLFQVAQTVKHGLPRADALRAVTIAPAEFLGIDRRVGSLEAGKDADILLFDGDPLSAQSRVRQVIIQGTPVYSGE